MYSTTDFKRGLKIEMDKTPFEIMEFEHYKPGKGGAIVRTRLRNMNNGKIIAAYIFGLQIAPITSQMARNCSFTELGKCKTFHFFGNGSRSHQRTKGKC